MLRSSRRTFSLPWGRDGLRSLSCPLGWTLSLLYLSASIEMMWFGSIAFIGFISTWWCQKQETRDAGCFSALLRAHSISTYQIKSFERDNYLFQCLHRAHPISTINKTDKQFFQSLFQCPTSGSSHFNAVTFGVALVVLVGFNALHRAHPISTWRKVGHTRQLLSVSMPYIGLIPFLRYHPSNPDRIDVFSPDFKGYFTEYSENYNFPP